MCAERPRSAAILRAGGLSVLFALSATAVHAEEQIFEPGTRHVCVPAASGEGWDCDSGENPPAAAKPPREPRLRSSSEVSVEGAAEPAAAPTGLTHPATRDEPAVAPVRGAVPDRPALTDSANPPPRSVPNYLLAPEARESAPRTPAQPARVVAEPPRSAAAADTTATTRPQTAAAQRELPAAAPATVPATAATPASAPATASVPSAPAVAPDPASGSATAESRPISTSRVLFGAAEFRRLADSRYVIELGSGHSRDAAERSATTGAPADGPVYLLALQRDGESWYLAVWGDFDSVDAARSARAELLAGGATGVGWPRRAGPLKQELGR